MITLTPRRATWKLEVACHFFQNKQRVQQQVCVVKHMHWIELNIGPRMLRCEEVRRACSERSSVQFRYSGSSASMICTGSCSKMSPASKSDVSVVTCAYGMFETTRLFP